MNKKYMIILTASIKCVTHFKGKGQKNEGKLFFPFAQLIKESKHQMYLISIDMKFPLVILILLFVNNITGRYCISYF